MADVDYRPAPGSFLWAVGNAHPNTRVVCANTRDAAGPVSREVAAMLSEIDALRAERDRWQALALKLANEI